MSKSTITVIIPSRKQENQLFFLRRSVKSVLSQTVLSDFDVNIIVAVDGGEGLGFGVCSELGVSCVESEGQSQAAALNAAIRTLNCDYVAFLEDDDRWQPQYLEVIQHVIATSDFISSNQVEIDEDGNLYRFLDFPTPSGWFMPMSTLAKVGLFNEKFRYHIDNEWLGRLNQTDMRRIHIVDRYIPDSHQKLQEQRIDLFLLLKATGNRCHIFQHNRPFPLVQRYIHSGSGMAQISQNSEIKSLSEQEYSILIDLYGFIPT